MKFNARFKRLVLAGKHPALTDEPDLEPGQELVIERHQVSIVVQRFVKGGGWQYRVRDFRPRYLAKHGGYTHDPRRALGATDRQDRGNLHDEPTGVPKDVEDKITRDAGEAEVIRLRSAWEQKRAEITRAINELREAGITDRELWVVEKRLQRLDEKIPGEAA